VYVCAWFVIRTVRISLVLSCFWDKDLLFLSLTHSALERREQLLGSDDARKRNHIGRSIIKTTLSTFVSFMSILYEKYTKCSAKVKWTDSSVRMACVLLYHINRTILLFFSLSLLLLLLLKNNINGQAYDSFKYSLSILLGSIGLLAHLASPISPSLSLLHECHRIGERATYTYALLSIVCATI